jgi:hypothetical protein
MKLDSLFHLRKYLKLKNHEPGRICVKVNPSVLADPAVRDLSSMDEKPPGVHKVKLSVLSRTVSIDYDPRLIPPKLLEELIVTQDRDRGRHILADLGERIGLSLL